MSDRGLATEPFKEFCAALNHHDVDYVVIGSEAVAFHGVPRFSVDFDVFVRPTTANLLRVKAALESLGPIRGRPEIWAKRRAFRIMSRRFRSTSCCKSAASTTPPRQGMRWRVWRHPVRFLGRDSLIKNKKASGRPDLAEGPADIRTIPDR
jgi:hypothetical protein